MNGALPIDLLQRNSEYGGERLKVNNEALRQVYLAKAAQAAQQLDPRQAATIGLYSDQGPPQGYLEQYLADKGTADKAKQVPGLLNPNPNSPRIDPSKPWTWLDKGKQVKG